MTAARSEGGTSMANDRATNGNARLEALRQREAALKVAITQERVRVQKKRERDTARLAAVIGEALLQHAGRSPEFTRMLRQLLQTVELTSGQRSFLTEKGWH
jgi:hypothetical protein